MILANYLEKKLPVVCPICRNNEHDRASLVQSTCCTDSDGVPLIPALRPVYHKACLRGWSDTIAGDSFPCVTCHKVDIPKAELLSLAERIKLFSSHLKEIFKQTIKLSSQLIITSALAITLDSQPSHKYVNCHNRLIGTSIIFALFSSAIGLQRALRKHHMRLTSKRKISLVSIVIIPSTFFYMSALKALMLYVDKKFSKA